MGLMGAAKKNHRFVMAGILFKSVDNHILICTLCMLHVQMFVTFA